MKTVLLAALTALTILLGLCAWMLTQHTLSLLDAVRADEHQAAVTLNGIPELVNARLDSFQTETLKRIDIAVLKADRQLSGANHAIGALSVAATAELPRLRVDLSDSLRSVTRDVDGIAAGLQPTLEHAAQITEYANEASAILLRRDALPAQLLGLTAAGKITLGETAQTMRTVRIAAPQVVDDVRGVAADVRREADALTRPKHWWQRALNFIGLGATAAAHAF